jgi:hypothetical protein
MPKLSESAREKLHARKLLECEHERNDAGGHVVSSAGRISALAICNRCALILRP